MANITFRSNEQAQKAVSKFNGAPIDGGRTKLKLNLIVDPSQTVQDLSQRIKPLNQRGGRAQVTRGPNVRGPNPRNQNTRGPNQKAQNTRGPNKKAALVKSKARQQKREKPAKKSLEDLDKEMADYFEEKK